MGFVPQQLLRLRGENETVAATDTLTFHGDDASTTVSYLAEFEFKGVAKLAGPLMALPLKKLGDDAEANLSNALQAL